MRNKLNLSIVTCFANGITTIIMIRGEERRMMMRRDAHTKKETSQLIEECSSFHLGVVKESRRKATV